MVSFAAEPIFKVGFFTVTNSVLNTILVDILILIPTFYIYKHISKIPGKIQNGVEMMISGFYGLTESVAGNNTDKIFPFFATFFIFILIANWSGLIPVISLITWAGGEHHEAFPLLKATTSDFNTTLGLALVSAAATHILSLRTLGLKDYLSRFLSINPIYLFVGLLELVSEVTKVLSLSFRLFGNIYAGEVVLGTVSKVFAFGFPLPFLGLEIIVGLIQATVFAMLTMAFMSILMTSHHEEAKEVVDR
jgi:F-type H+-transporting ATPase subunit a